jgi:hypothetical protein
MGCMLRPAVPVYGCFGHGKQDTFLFLEPALLARIGCPGLTATSTRDFMMALPGCPQVISTQSTHLDGVLGWSGK